MTQRVTDLQRRSLRLISSGRFYLDPATGGAKHPTMNALRVTRRTLESLIRRNLVVHGDTNNNGIKLVLTDAGQTASGLEARGPYTPPPPVPCLPMADMEPRRLYRIHSRNLVVGVWDPDTNGFLGIRQKFGDRYVFTEFHRDTGAPYGTVSPAEALDAVVPDHIGLDEYLGTVCRTCRIPLVFDKDREPDQRWAHETPTDCERASAVAVSNTALFDWLLPHEDTERARLAADRAARYPTT